MEDIMTDEYLIRHCAPTLACIKTGNLFSCPFSCRDSMNVFVRDLNSRMGKKGLRVLPLRYKNGSGLIYVYRPDMLEQDLNNPHASSLLNSCGYHCKNGNYCIRKLIARLAEEEEFPHEIGLFLSYPPEDVYGFIHHKNEAKCCGCWKVYGDVDAAQRTFARYKKCSDLYMRLWNQGYCIEQLTVAV